jgi:hypothetical protein
MTEPTVRMATVFRGVDQDQFRILDGREPDDGSILNGDPVARFDPCAVHLDSTVGRDQIAVTCAPSA